MSNKRWKNRDALVTVFDDLIIDENFDGLKILRKITQESKFYKRANDKSMCSIPENAHTTTRGDHMGESAAQAVRLANGLGLNEIVAETGMEWHDAGQYFWAHDGEKTADIIAQILYLGYCHHTAEGGKVILNERIIPKIIKAIPEAKTNKELRDRIKNDIWYFIEMVVGHDGEATSKDIKRLAKQNDQKGSLKEQVLYNISKAIRTNNYKCPVTTLEAQLAKPADILAYMKSDVMTGFQDGIITKLSDNYLEIIGKLLDESEEETLKIEDSIEKASNEEKNQIITKVREERIKKARRIMRQIKIDKLIEIEDDIDSDSDKDILDEIYTYMKELDDRDIEITDINLEQLEIAKTIKAKILHNFEQKCIEKGYDKNTIISQKNKLERSIRNVEKERKRVIEELMTKVQDTLREDYIQSTLKRWEEIEKNEDLTDKERYALKKQSMDFSDKVNKIIYGKNGMKDLNYKEIVQYSKKVYQTGCMPKAIYKLVEKCSKDIVKTGVIINKFYDPEVLKYIDDDKLKELMHQRDIDDIKDKKFIQKMDRIKRKAQSVKKAREMNKRKFTSEKGIVKHKIHRYALCSDIKRFIEEQREGFARECQDVYEAIPYTVKDIVEKAIRAEYKQNQYLPDEERKAVKRVKKELAKRFAGIDQNSITTEQLKTYIDEKIEAERKNIELKVATRYVLDYISGKTNTGIKELVINNGILSQRAFDRENIPNLTGNEVVKNLSNNLIAEDEGAKKMSKISKEKDKKDNGIEK